MKLADPTLLKSQCLVDGAWVGTPVIPSTIRPPASKSPKCRRSPPRMRPGRRSRRARLSAWAKLTAKQRSNILRKWFELIVANREDLALILTSEQGKPLAEALGEVDIGGAYVEFFAEEARRVYGETIPLAAADARLLAIKQPIGVAARSRRGISRTR